MITDKKLEKQLLAKLLALEVLNDSVGPTPLRHRLSELIVEARKTLLEFDQAEFERSLQL